MALSVLESRPAKLGVGLARHRPPTVGDVLAPHVSDLAGPLARNKDHSQGRRAHQAGGAEGVPKRLDLGVRQDSLAALGLVLLDAPAWIALDEFLLDRPSEHGRCGGP